MNIPNIPTDNLYKFQALSGVIIVLLSFYVTIDRINEVRLKILESTEEAKIIGAKTSALSERIETLKNIIENTVHRQNDKHTKDITKVEITYTNSEIKELFIEVYEKNLMHKIEQVKNESSIEKAKYLHEESKRIFKMGVFASIIGFVMSITGFRWWYFRVQKPLDKLLKNQIINRASNKSFKLPAKGAGRDR